MTSPVAVIGLIWDGFDLQRPDLDILFEITEGLDSLPEMRGEDQVIPFRSGRLAAPRLADRRPVVVTGWIAGPAGSSAAVIYRGYLDSLKSRLDPTGPPGILVATLEDGSKRWISAVPRNLIGGDALGSDFRAFSIEWEALDPYWYSSWGTLALDTAPLVYGPYPDPYSDAVLATNPVGYWRLGEPSGTVAVDEMGANNGTYVNTPALGVAGLLTGDPDTAVTLAAASSQRVTAAVAAALNPYPNFSVAAWIKTTAGVGVYYGIAGLWDATGTTGWDFYLDGSNRLSGSVRGSSSIAWGDSAYGPFLSDGVRHFCVMVATGTSLQIFVDGVATHAALAGTWTYSSLPAVGVSVGSRGTGLYFTGTIDEPAIWNRALSPAEIVALYAAGSTVVSYPVIGSGSTLDDGLTLDASAEIVIVPSSISHTVAFDTLGTADVERIRIRMTGPSLMPPGIEVDTPDGVVGFVLASALVAGETFDLDNYARTAVIGVTPQRRFMTLKAANRNGEYVRFRPGLNTVRILGQPASARILFTPTFQ